MAIEGRAHDNTIIHTHVGTNAGSAILGNRNGGVLLAPGTWGTVIDGPTDTDNVRIAFELGNGLTIRSSRRNRISNIDIIGNLGIGLLAEGLCVGTVVSGYTIERNQAGDIDVSRARGIVITPQS